MHTAATVGHAAHWTVVSMRFDEVAAAAAVCHAVVGKQKSVGKAF
jgi:hypothetical protein